MTAEEINKAFENTNFGGGTPEGHVKYGLLKVASGYTTGHTIKCILQELGLITKSLNHPLSLTKKGQEYFYEIFKEAQSEQPTKEGELRGFAIWLTGCGYDFAQHDYFQKNRHLLQAPTQETPEMFKGTMDSLDDITITPKD